MFVVLLYLVSNYMNLFQTLNDIANKRWNGTDATFIPKQLETIPHEDKRTKYTFYHLFSSKRFFKQSMMQILSMFTYSLVSICYMYVIKYFTGGFFMLKSIHLRNYKLNSEFQIFPRFSSCFWMESSDPLSRF